MVAAAADGGGGSPSDTFGVVGALFGGVVGAAVAGVNDLMSNLADMKKFKKDVDGLLVELHGSQAAPTRVGQDRMQRTHLGGEGFHEAQFLYASYDNVHTELENLSKTLGLQIESMSLAIETSGKSYNDLDEDIKSRMHKLNSEIEAQYHPDRDPYHTADKGKAKPGAGNSVGGFGDNGGAK
ncbi:hypothetical protein [Streptomyces fuscigenes]|uniref:hypothetical protein n=1 Tax=Streptomyces fuscigenes TaxID=1528880 RepID=UPI001F48402B|nr:hypothetical protein [Streptomyces fuscigenes]MCF3961725.1 hypothetical protein [Streptomyces fuscigenes]